MISYNLRGRPHKEKAEDTLTKHVLFLMRRLWLIFLMWFLVVSDFIDWNVSYLKDGTREVFERINVVILPLPTHMPKITRTGENQNDSTVLDWSRCPISIVHLSVTQGNVH